MRRDAVVSLAAGRSQLPLLERIRARGLAAIGVDRDPRAPGLALCDEAVHASTHDAGAVVDSLRRLSERYRIRAVLAKSSGPPVAAAARAAAALGLPGLDPGGAELSTSKAGFARLCAERGVAAPRQVAAREPGDVLRAGLAPPLVVKPSRGRVGKRGVVRVQGRAALGSAFARARDASDDGCVVAQEHVPGEDVALGVLFRDGRVRPFALLDEEVDLDEAGEARGVGTAVPSRYAGTAVERAVRGAAGRLLAGLGTGVGFLSFRVDSSGAPLAIEAHLDLAGDHVAEVLLARGAGFDPLEAALDLHLGGAFPEEVPELAPAAVRLVYADDARRGLGLLAELAEVALDGAPVGDARGGRVGHALLRAATRAVLDELARAADELLGRAAEPARGAAEGW